MCVTSAVGDYWKDGLPQRPYYPGIQPFIQFPLTAPAISREEFDQLKRDVEELKKLLLAAKQFDDATGQPHCEADEKVALIKKLAGHVGVSMEEIFGKTA